MLVLEDFPMISPGAVFATFVISARMFRGKVAMQARFCDTTAFGRRATEGERAGGKFNGTRAHET
jgi:hypothetical protein